MGSYCIIGQSLSIENRKGMDMKNRKKRLLLIVLALSLCMSVLASCSKTDTVQTETEVFTEGTDTSVTITSYTDFSKAGDYFLEEGDRIAVIAPSALAGLDKVELMMEGVRKWGYVPVKGKYVSVEERTLEECIEDLVWALNDPEIKAIYPVRGGHASSEVLDQLPLSLIKDANKPIIGFSDISACLSAWTVSGLPSIHASMWGCFDGSMPTECTDAIQNVMKGQIPVYQCQGSEYDIPGSVEGVLIGGNLATLTTVLDTDYDCTMIEEPFILFLEEVEEDYEHIHRFLTILDHKGILDKASGLIFGEWVDIPKECDTYNGNSRGGKFKSVADMISREFLEGRKIPVAFGFPAGHANVNYPLLMGVKLKLDVREDSYTMEWINEE